MAITGLNHHFARVQDLERLRRFDCEALGFEVMPRPLFPFPGHWLGVNGKIQWVAECATDGASVDAPLSIGGAIGRAALGLQPH